MNIVWDRILSGNQKVFFVSKSYVIRTISNIPQNTHLKIGNSPTLDQASGPKQLGFKLGQYVSGADWQIYLRLELTLLFLFFFF